MSKYWRVAMITALGLVIVAGVLAVAYLHLDTTFSPVQRLASQMSRNPDADTAAALVDLALEEEENELLYQVLMEHVAPHLQVRGVTEQYLRGFKAYLERDLDLRALELAEPLAHISPPPDLPSILSGAFISHAHRDWRQALETGLVMTERGWMTSEAMTLFSRAHFALIVELPLPDANNPSAQDLQLLASGLDRLEQTAGFRADVTLLTLWMVLANQENINYHQIAEQVDVLSREELASEEALTVFWQTRALALLLPLEPGWEHPLGWDVTSHTEVFFTHLTEQWQQQVSQILTEYHADARQALFVYQLGRYDQQTAEELAKTMLAALGVASGSELGLLPDEQNTATSQMDVAPVLWEPLGQQLAEALEDIASRWPENTALQPGGSLVEMLKEQQTPALIRNRQQLLFFDTLYYQQRPGRQTQPAVMSPGLPALAIPDSRGGITLVDLRNWNFIRLSGEMATWSPDGSRIAVVSNQEGFFRIRIFNIGGAIQSDFVIGREYHSFDWFVWPTPDLLLIERSTAGSVEQIVISVSSRSLTERRPGRGMTRILGSDFLSDGINMFTLSGEQIGNTLTIQPDASAQQPVITIPQLDAAVYRRDNSLIFKDQVGWEKQIYSGEDIDAWLAAEEGSMAVLYQGKLYLVGLSETVAFDVSSGEVSVLRPDWLLPVEQNIAELFPLHFWSVNNTVFPLVAQCPDNMEFAYTAIDSRDGYVLVLFPKPGQEYEGNIPLLITEFR